MGSLQPTRARFLAPTLGVALALACATLFGGCFVSFDGYQLASDHDAGVIAGGASGAGGTSAGAGISGNAGNAGAGMGGASASSGSGGISGVAGGGASGSPGTSGSSGMGGMGTAGISGASGSSGVGGSSGVSGSAGVSGVSGSSGASGSAGVSGSSGASGSSGSGGVLTCPDTGLGPVLIDIPKPGGGIICIDRNEVTNNDYSLFLATNPSISAQTSECIAWNTNFAPETSGAGLGNCATTNYALGGMAKLPVDCIDWCDAKKFCEYSGKHLCGKIGGGPIAASAFADASQDEWYAACSQGGVQQFPYGTAWMSGACQDSSGSGTRATSVPTSSCEGGYGSIFDMVGNVAEWEDSCVTNTGAATDQCLVRGGGYLNYNTQFPAATCNSNPLNASSPQPATRSRQTRAQDVGFRCCLDP